MRSELKYDYNIIESLFDRLDILLNNSNNNINIRNNDKELIFIRCKDNCSLCEREASYIYIGKKYCWLHSLNL